MPRRTVQESDKIQFNELYLKYGTYAEVARQTGFSASTVRRYIVPNYVSQDILEDLKVEFAGDLQNLGPKLPYPKTAQDWQNLFLMSEEEKEEIEELRKEIGIWMLL